MVVRVFEFEGHDGTRTRMDELAYQRWEGDRIVEEKFFYSLNGVAPTAENVKSGRYFLTRDFLFVIRGGRRRRRSGFSTSS